MDLHLSRLIWIQYTDPVFDSELQFNASPARALGPSWFRCTFTYPMHLRLTLHQSQLSSASMCVCDTHRSMCVSQLSRASIQPHMKSPNLTWQPRHSSSCRAIGTAPVFLEVVRPRPRSSKFHKSKREKFECPNPTDSKGMQPPEAKHEAQSGKIART